MVKIEKKVVKETRVSHLDRIFGAWKREILRQENVYNNVNLHSQKNSHAICSSFCVILLDSLEVEK